MRFLTFASLFLTALVRRAGSQETSTCAILPGSYAQFAIAPYFCMPAGLDSDLNSAAHASTNQLFENDAPGANVTELKVGEDTWRFACNLQQHTLSSERLAGNGERKFSFVSFVNGSFPNETTSSCDNVFGELRLRELNERATRYLPFSTDWDAAADVMGLPKPSHNVTRPQSQTSCEISFESDDMSYFKNMIEQLARYPFPYGDHCAYLGNFDVTACLDAANADSLIHMRFISPHAPADARNDAAAKIYAGHDAEKGSLTAYFEATEETSDKNEFLAMLGNATVIVPDDDTKPCVFPVNFLRDAAKRFMYLAPVSQAPSAGSGNDSRHFVSEASAATPFNVLAFVYCVVVASVWF